MTDQELKDLVASLAVSRTETKDFFKETKELFKETDKKFKETDKKFKETDKQLKEIGRKLDKVGLLVGNISNNQGDVAEEYFVNSLKDSLKIANIDFDLLLTNVGLKTKNIRDEFDILLVNGESVALIEVKYKVHPNILEVLPKKIEHLKLMPQYKSYKIYAGIAGFYIPDEVIEEATKKGYFVLQRKGDIIQTYADNLKAA